MSNNVLRLEVRIDYERPWPGGKPRRRARFRCVRSSGPGLWLSTSVVRADRALRDGRGDSLGYGGVPAMEPLQP